MSSKIEKKDLKTIYRRYLALNCMNDYPGQMHNGYTFSLLPVLDKIYKDNKEERIKAKKRHMEYFNITPNMQICPRYFYCDGRGKQKIQEFVIQLSIQ